MPKATRVDLGTPKTLTNVSMGPAALVGLVIAAAIYGGAWALKDFPSFPVYTYLFERGWFQYVSTLAFGVTMGILYLKTDRIKAEKAAFKTVDETVFAPLTGYSAL